MSHPPTRPPAEPDPAPLPQDAGDAASGRPAGTPPPRRRGRHGRWIKRAGLLLALVLSLLAGGATYLFQSVRGVPDFYATSPMTDQERLEALEGVERKVLRLQGDLDRASRAIRGRAGGAVTASQPQEDAADAREDRSEDRFGTPGGGLGDETPADERIVRVELDGRELDTAFQQWLLRGGHDARLAPHLQNPRIVVHDGRLILAGRLTRTQAVASLHFIPTPDQRGLELAGVYVGRLPVPRALLDDVRRRTIQALSLPQPASLGEAAVSEAGVVNLPAVLMLTKDYVVGLLTEGRVGPPFIEGDAPDDKVLIFPPVGPDQYLPLRLVSLSAEGTGLVIEAMPLAPEEVELLARQLDRSPPPEVARR